MSGTDQPGGGPNPNHEMTVGLSWEVRPTLRTDIELEPASVRPVEARMRRAGYRCSLGLVGGPGDRDALTGTIVVDAGSPGQAADETIRAITDHSHALGIEITDLREVVIVPAWLDERDW